MTIFSPLPGSRGPRSWPPVRCQGALLSRPIPPRSTPIATTELHFRVRLWPDQLPQIHLQDISSEV